MPCVRFVPCVEYTAALARVPAIDDPGHSFRCVIADDDHPIGGVRRTRWVGEAHRGGCGDADGRGGAGGLALTGVDAGIASEALNRPSLGAWSTRRRLGGRCRRSRCPPGPVLRPTRRQRGPTRFVEGCSQWPAHDCVEGAGALEGRVFGDLPGGLLVPSTRSRCAAQAQAARRRPPRVRPSPACSPSYPRSAQAPTSAPVTRHAEW